MLLFGVKSSSFVHPAEMFQLTLDPPTAEWLRGYYANLSGVILEYGSGGSASGAEEQCQKPSLLLRNRFTLDVQIGYIHDPGRSVGAFSPDSL